MRKALFLLVAAAACAPAWSQQGTNCAIAEPPPDAGENIAMRGGLYRVYPRRGAMKKDYTGCQSLWWLQADGSHTKGLMAWYERGAVRRIAILFPAEDRGFCEYRAGKLATRDRPCPDGDDLRNRFPLRSVRAGCFADFEAGRKPPECEKPD